jgi:DNA-binding NarL/FixJ family response regulator
MPPSVLVVEDERDAREMLVRGLERQGHTVVAAADGEEAQALLGPAYDAIVTDLVMPRRDGLELLRELDRRHDPAVRVVLTSYADKERVTAALNLGADYLVEKPFTAEQLGAVLERLIARRPDAEAAMLERYVQRRLRSLAISDRDRALVEGVLRGLGNKQIAAAMGVGEQSVKNALTEVYRQLGIASRGELFHLMFPI